ncbi:hypothetical protein SAMN05216328_1615 [Ensifer sp. YR511]|nr:hypothetical protein SAMN05216328_1615 [Ensifer sp. YR511]
MGLRQIWYFLTVAEEALQSSRGADQSRAGRPKAGNPRLRTAMVELAWLWLRYAISLPSPHESLDESRRGHYCKIYFLSPRSINRPMVRAHKAHMLRYVLSRKGAG